jgi:hypothetical protein
MKIPYKRLEKINHLQAVVYFLEIFVYFSIDVNIIEFLGK